MRVTLTLTWIIHLFRQRKRANFDGARLHRLRKKSVSAGVLKGRTFRACPEPAEGCAVKLFIFVITSGLQPAKDLLLFAPGTTDGENSRSLTA